MLMVQLSHPPSSPEILYDFLLLEESLDDDRLSYPSLVDVEGDRKLSADLACSARAASRAAESGPYEDDRSLRGRPSLSSAGAPRSPMLDDKEPER